VNPDTQQLLDGIVGKLQRSVRAGECPAMAALGGSRPLTLSDYDYLRDEEAATRFEQRAAAKARETGATRWVIAVPQVWVTAPGVISVRAVSNLPLRPGESEAITWMAFDLSDGVDYGRVPFTRRPRGEPVFGNIEILTRPARPAPGMPGYTMLRLIVGDGTASDGSEPDTAR